MPTTPTLPTLKPRGFLRGTEFLHETFFMQSPDPTIAMTLVSLEDAQAAILADRRSRAPEGWVCVPREPTEAMWTAGRDPVMHRDLRHNPALFPSETGDCPAWQINPKTGQPEKDTSKGTTAVHVWRAMIAAAPVATPPLPAQLVGYVGSNRDIIAPPQDRYEQPPEGTLLATPAEPAARAQGAEEVVVLWQYRWTNPGNYSHQSDDALAWKEVVPNTLQTMEDRVSELRGCKSDGKHCYEVRPLYTAPTLPQPAATAGKAEDELAVAIDMLARWCVAIDRNGTGWDDWDEHYKDAAYRPCRLREKLDAAMTKIKKEYE